MRGKLSKSEEVPFRPVFVKERLVRCYVLGLHMNANELSLVEKVALNYSVLVYSFTVVILRVLPRC